jgi:hypothetical protein
LRLQYIGALADNGRGSPSPPDIETGAPFTLKMGLFFLVVLNIGHVQQNKRFKSKHATKSSLKDLAKGVRPL